MACFSGFLVGREVATRMIPRKRGTILFTGATASVRGSAQFAAFASAKFGLRALSQSMARELGEKGIHVAHIVIDGAIDTPWIHANFPQAKERQAIQGNRMIYI
jgi:NAD(P)-dependent dehydrogenase (short-subunit alcohol dehydrogenase family)